ncbi:MAG: GNAT family N-acetyltransferase [Candidatus Heimdallarchaeota archaeon]|nr:MAG: GNAT family N-acetyltransferase [Candidatus Heimdallarchaeota archaeon]
MIIQNLNSTSLSDITKCFNESFEDYIIQFTATEDYLRNRWKGAGVDFGLSFGAFIDRKLVGFVIHGIDEWHGLKTAFNVGTGVIPKHRGKRIVKKFYETTIPILKDHGIEQCRLEVIQENLKAINAYKSVGFQEDRELISFSYNLDHKKDETALDKHIQLKIRDNISNIDWNLLKTFWDFDPSWENSNSSLMRNAESWEFLEMSNDNQMIGYAIFNPKTGYIAQFGTSKEEREKGYIKVLFQKLRSLSNQLVVINVDKRAIQILNFLKTFGFKEFVKQYEMEKSLI